MQVECCRLVPLAMSTVNLPRGKAEGEGVSLGCGYRTVLPPVALLTQRRVVGVGVILVLLEARVLMLFKAAPVLLVGAGT